MAVEYDISSDVAVIKETGSVSQCARVTQMYSGQITYDDEAGSKFATATINGKSQRVMLCIAVSGTVTYDDVPSLYSTVDGHRCLNIVTPTETGTPDDVPSLYETVVIDGQNVRAVRCIMINKTPVYDGVSSTCTFTGDDGKTHTAQLVNKVTGGSVQVIIKGTSPLVLPDAIANSLSYVKAFGGTEQNGTPTPDTPVDIVSNNGAIKFSLNELNPSEIVIGYYRTSATGALTESPYNFVTGFMPVKPGQSYVFFGRRQDDDRLSSYNRIHWFDANKEYVSTNTYTKDNVGTGVAPSNAYFAQCSCNESGATSRETTQEIVDGYNWVFQQGTAEVPYVPYVEGGIYTDGTVETINAHGKNFFNKNMPNVLISGFIRGDGAFIPSESFRTVIYPLQIGETYTITRATSTPTTAAMRVAAYNTQQPRTTDNSVVLFAGAASSKTATITVPDGYPYIATYVKHSSDTISDAELLDGFQIEKGSTATEYEPYYDGGTATAEMLLKVGDYQDEQEILSGAVTRKIGIRVLKGTESWVSNSSNVYTFGLNGALKPPVSPNRIAIPCTHFVGTNAANASMPNNSIKQGTFTAFPNDGGIGVKMTSVSGVAGFKQWLADQYNAGTPVIVLYPLATPTTESVAGQTLQVTDGDNVLEITQASLDGLELEAQYNAAVELTIQEVQDANLDNNVTVTIQ